MKISSFYVLLVIWVIYDVFGRNQWNTNWVIMYYSAFYSFVFFWAYISHWMSRDKFDKISYVIIMFFMSCKIILELSSFGLTKNEYYYRTNNEYIDILLWAALLILFLIALWAKFTHLRQK